MIGSLNLSQTQWARNVVQVSAVVSGEERCVTRQITAAWETSFDENKKILRHFAQNYAPIKSKLQHPPGHLTIFCARGVGNLTGKAFPGVGNLTFAWVGWGKLNRKCQVSNGFFFGRRVANSLNTCLDEMEEFKGRV